MARARQKLSDIPASQRPWVIGLIAASLGLVAVAEVDIQRRPAEQVRGSRLIWRVVCLNAVGAVAYFRWGRRG